jgi:hypothetical protein
MKPWVEKRVEDLFGMVEDELVNFVVTSIGNACPASEIETELEAAMGEDAAQFVTDTWKHLIQVTRPGQSLA